LILENFYFRGLRVYQVKGASLATFQILCILPSSAIENYVLIFSSPFILPLPQRPLQSTFCVSQHRLHHCFTVQMHIHSTNPALNAFLTMRPQLYLHPQRWSSNSIL
jgi:hypothetical protein